MRKKKESSVELLKPTDVTLIGSTDDPCFGISYDLSTSECKRCGDSELCAIKFANTMHITRTQLQQENEYMDMANTIDLESVKKFIRALIRKGVDKKEIIQGAMVKFNLSKKEVRDIYRQIKK